MQQLSAYPARRSVKNMSALFGAANAGDALAVSFESERYGRFRVEGFASLSITEDLLVGGVPVAKELKVAKDGTPNRQPEAEVRVASTDATDDGALSIPIAPADAAHGDVVRAEFEHPLYGPFTIMGVLTLTDQHTQPAVGGWFTDPEQGGKFLVSLEILATAAESPLETPVRRTVHVEDVEL